MYPILVRDINCCILFIANSFIMIGEAIGFYIIIRQHRRHDHLFRRSGGALISNLHGSATCNGTKGADAASSTRWFWCKLRDSGGPILYEAAIFLGRIVTAKVHIVELMDWASAGWIRKNIPFSLIPSGIALCCAIYNKILFFGFRMDEN